MYAQLARARTKELEGGIGKDRFRDALLHTPVARWPAAIDAKPRRPGETGEPVLLDVAAGGTRDGSGARRNARNIAQKAAVARAAAQR